MLQACLTAWRDWLQIHQDTTRWQAPADPDLLPHAKLARIVRQLYPCKVPAAQKNWAAFYNVLLNRALNDRGSSVELHHQVPVICCVHRAAGARNSTFSYYVACEKVRSSRRLVECSLSNNGGDDNKWVHVRKPLTFRNSIDVIASLYCNVTDASGMVQTCIVPVHRSTASMCDLSLVGTYGVQAPVPMTTLKPPSKKLQKKLWKAELQHHDSNKAAAGAENEDESADEDHETLDVKPEVCGDSQVMEGMHLLMEEAAAFADADSDDDDDGCQLGIVIDDSYAELETTNSDATSISHDDFVKMIKPVSNIGNRVVLLYFPAMDADNVHFGQAKEATEQMVLRELHEHVCAGPMPLGAVNITNLPIREFSSPAQLMTHFLDVCHNVAKTDLDIKPLRKMSLVPWYTLMGCVVPLDVTCVIGEFMDGSAEDEDVFVGPVPCAPTLQERIVDTLPDGFLYTCSI
ncbi:unnamed protein product [Symbiodinium sp. KB8]|nr:unnamed protein product [Symbiodinium sp. KB8]